MYLRYTTQCFDIHMHSKMIAIVKQMISSTTICTYLCVWVGMITSNYNTGWQRDMYF
jgi:hypothetical protein